MYCRNCYADLRAASGPECPKCGRAFDAANPRTFLARPFPGPLKVVLQVVGTTLLAVLAAYVVAFHQMARSSGH